MSDNDEPMYLDEAHFSPPPPHIRQRLKYEEIMDRVDAWWTKKRSEMYKLAAAHDAGIITLQEWSDLTFRDVG